MSTPAQPQPRALTTPTIREVSPISAAPGDQVSIVGTNFGDSAGNGYLQFFDDGTSWGAPGNSAQLHIVSWNDSEISFLIPEKDSNGFETTPGTTARINVTNSGGLTSNTAFIPVKAAPPVIQSLIPSTAAPGTSIAIGGKNFGSTRGTGYVQFVDSGVSWGAPGNVATFELQSWADDKITFLVPVKDVHGYQTSPGTAATITVTNGFGQTSNALLLNLKTASPPTIHSISPSSAAAGATIVINGKDFGSSPGAAGYLQFVDNGTSWGAPGNTAQFKVISWTDDQIRFEVPVQDAQGFHVTPGTTATVTVVNGNGLASNPETLSIITAVIWPVALDTGKTQIGTSGNGFMQTTVSISNDGLLNASTRIWDISPAGPLTGFHGAAVVALFDTAGTQIGTYSGGPWGVEGGQNRTISWTGRLTPDQRAQIFKVAATNFYDPQYQDLGSVANWIVQHASQLAEIAVIVVAIAS
jgi:hypothetical protein